MKKIIFTLLLTTISTAAFAAGPFYLYETASGGYDARTWAGGTFNWKYDTGTLGPYQALPATDADKETCKNLAGQEKPLESLCGYMMKPCGIVMCIEVILKEWAEKKSFLGDNVTQVATSSIKAVNAGSIGKDDITSENFSIESGYKYKDDLPEKTVLIIFDDEAKDGILAQVGHGDKLGLTGLEPNDDKTANYTGGWLILNGKMAGDETFPATIMHELGHLMGLDHSQLQKASMDAANNEKVEEGVPTMYPYLLGKFQFVLNIDDTVSLAMLYPTSGFKNSFCVIEGDLTDADDKPYQGINVIAYANGASEQFLDSRSSVSGAIYPPCSDDKGSGHYVLAGLVPGVPYNVIYEPIYSEFRNVVSGMNPYNENICNLKPGLENSGLVTFGGKQLVACSAKAVGNIADKYKNAQGLVANSTVPPEAVYIENKANISAGTTGLDSTPVTEEATDSGGKKGWCGSLMGGVSPVWGGLLPVLAGVLLALRLRKQNL